MRTFKFILLFCVLWVQATIVSAQIITTVAGSGIPGYSGDGGPATAAKMSGTSGLRIDRSGNIFVCELGFNIVRKISAAGIISTFAGSGTAGYSGDGGPATAAKLNAPTDLCFDASGNMYISDRQNSCIRKVDASGNISTIAGTGSAGYNGDGIAATAAQLNKNYGIAFDVAGNLLVADESNNSIRSISPAGIISTIAGDTASGFSGDGGAATAARLFGPVSIVVDRHGNTIFADFGNNRIRKIDVSGNISTIAGNGTRLYTGDGGPATAAGLNGVLCITMDRWGNLFEADDYSSTVRKIDTFGTITTIAGTGTGGVAGDGGAATATMIINPQGLAVDSNGAVYISEAQKVRKVYCVPPTVSPISGPAVVCLGDSVALTDATAGGVWMATNTNATFSATGMVTGLAIGTDTLIYTVTNTCGSTSVQQVVTVMGLPSAGTLSGPVDVCTGSTAAYTATVTGGAWSLAGFGSAYASLDTAGHLRGVIPGNVTIYYMVTNSCGIDTALFNVHIHGMPVSGLIGGTTQICINAPGGMLFSTDTGGVWSSATSALATIEASTGNIHALAAGRAVFVYTVTNLCGSSASYDTVTVNPFPTLSSSLYPPAICSGAPFTYTITSAAAGATFSWSRAAIPGILNASSHDTTAVINESLTDTTFSADTAIYQVTIAAGGCSNIQEVHAVINPSPSLAGTVNFRICSGSDFMYTPVSRVAGTTMTWTRAAVTGITPGSNSGSGTINEVLVNSSLTPQTVLYAFDLNAQGCTVFENVSVTVDEPAPTRPTIATTPLAWQCRHSDYQNFGASVPPAAGVEYIWSAKNATIWATGNTKQFCLVNFDVDAETTVFLTAKYPGSTCVSRDSFIVVVGDVDAEHPPVTYTNGVFSTTGGYYSYQWGFDDINTLDSSIIPGATGNVYPDANPDFNRKLYWVISEHLWCYNKTYYKAPTAVANPEYHQSTSIKVVPNPNSGQFNLMVVAEQFEPASVVITDLFGKKVFEANCFTNCTNSIQLAQPAGVYFARIETAGSTLVEKFVIN